MKIVSWHTSSDISNEHHTPVVVLQSVGNCLIKMIEAIHHWCSLEKEVNTHEPGVHTVPFSAEHVTIQHRTVLGGLRTGIVIFVVQRPVTGGH